MNQNEPMDKAAKEPDEVRKAKENTYDEDEMDDIAEHMAELGFSI